MTYLTWLLCVALLVGVVVVAFCAAVGLAMWLADRSAQPVSLDVRDRERGGSSLRGAE